MLKFLPRMPIRSSSVVVAMMRLLRTTAWIVQIIFSAVRRAVAQAR